MKERGKTITQFLVILVMLVLSVLLAQGFSLDFSKLLTWAFWVEVASNLLISLMCYNAYYEMDNRNRRQDINGKHYTVCKKYQENVKRFYEGNYYEKLDKSIEWKNKAFCEEEYNRYLHAKCGSRLIYKDIEKASNIEEIDAICKGKLMTEKGIKRAKKCASKIFDGKIKAVQITFDDIMLDRVGDKHQKEGLAFNSGKYTAQKNMGKALSYLVISIVLAIIQWAWQGANLLETIVSKLTLCGSSIFSALIASRQYIRYRIANLEERNRLLENKVFKDSE